MVSKYAVEEIPRSVLHVLGMYPASELKYIGGGHTAGLQKRPHRLDLLPPRRYLSVRDTSWISNSRHKLPMLDSPRVRPEIHVLRSGALKVYASETAPSSHVGDE